MINTKSIDFSKFSSFKIGEKFEVEILDDCKHFNKDAYLIGSCNNILIGNNPPPLVILSKKYDYIKLEDDKLMIGAATPSGKVASFCKKNNIASFEFLSHLPGTIGGLIKMNAGLKEYEIFNNLINIKTCSGLKYKEDIDYDYRYTDIREPVLEATFEIKYGFDEQKVIMFKQMRSNQPKDPSAGSCFKNPKDDYAGRLIEEVGLKGVRVGGMEFSKVHANFLINTGGGTYDDAVFLIKEAQRMVYEKFKINLELEIVVLDVNFQY